MGIPLPTILRKAGLRVREEPGWEERGHGTLDPVGVMWHHTAGPLRGNDPLLRTCVVGRPDLPGPLCHVHLARDGTATVIAASRVANHAGKGNRNVLAELRAGHLPRRDAAHACRGMEHPEPGRCPLDTVGGNTWFYGIEVENSGAGEALDPYPPVQIDALVALTAAIHRHHGWTKPRVLHHRQWTCRKPDMSLRRDLVPALTALLERNGDADGAAATAGNGERADHSFAVESLSGWRGRVACLPRGARGTRRRGRAADRAAPLPARVLASERAALHVVHRLVRRSEPGLQVARLDALDLHRALAGGDGAGRWTALRPVRIATRVRPGIGGGGSGGQGAAAAGSGEGGGDGAKPPPPPPPKKSTTEPCEITAITLGCSHRKGKRLSLPPAAGAAAVRVIEVVAGETRGRDAITVDATVKTPLCATHADCVVALVPVTTPSRAGPIGRVAFDASCEPVEGLVKSLWLSRLPTRTYIASPMACVKAAGVDDLHVVVYPNVKWSVFARFNMKGLEEDEDVEFGKHGGWGFELKGSREYDGNKTELGVDFQKYLDGAWQFMRATKDALDFAGPALSLIGGPKLRPQWPDVSLTYEDTWEEDESSFTVRRVCRVVLKGDPFIGIEADWDILQFVLVALLSAFVGPGGPPMAKAIGEFRRFARKRRAGGVSGDIYINLIAHGCLKTGEKGLYIERARGALSWDRGGELQLELGLKLKAGAFLAADVFVAEIEARVEGSGSITFGIEGGIHQSDEEGVWLAGGLFFSGLTFALTAYVSGGVKFLHVGAKKSWTPDPVTFWQDKKWPGADKRLTLLPAGSP